MSLALRAPRPTSLNPGPPKVTGAAGETTPTSYKGMREAAMEKTRQALEKFSLRVAAGRLKKAQKIGDPNGCGHTFSSQPWPSCWLARWRKNSRPPGYRCPALRQWKPCAPCTSLTSESVQRSDAE